MTNGFANVWQLELILYARVKIDVFYCCVAF